MSKSPAPNLGRWTLFLGIGAGVLLFFWLLFDVAGWAVTGMVLGLALAGCWSPAEAASRPHDPRAIVAPQPFGPLARTALPLGLPLLIVVVAGTYEERWLLQLAAGAAASLFAWTLVVRPELPELKRVVAGLPVVWLGALVVVLGVATASTAGLTELVFEDRGGASAIALRGAVLFWVAAILLRLASFATSWLRLLEALALGLLVTRLVFLAGVVEGDEWLREHWSFADPEWILVLVVGLFAIDALIGIGGMLAGRTRQARDFISLSGALSRSQAGFVAGLGLATALIATFTLGLAVVIGLEESGREGKGRLTLEGEPIAPGLPTGAPADHLSDDRRDFPAGLVDTFMPILAFRTDQQWLPERVDQFVLDADRRSPWGRVEEDETLATLPKRCPGLAPTPCHRLTIKCKTAEDTCSRADSLGLSGMNPPKKSGAVYVRVLSKKHSPTYFPDGVGNFSESLSILIQYWYFYYYDEWTTPVLTGQLVQRHEGDWEAVVVGLSDKAPLFVGYSQHCSGEWRSWNQIEVADTERPRTRPLVAVARGSQANYPRADQERSPDWAQCAGVGSGTATLVSYASNIRDRTAYGFAWEPADTIPARETEPPMSFPGYWGGNGITLLENQREHELERGGEPRTPSMQPLWRKPVWTIFCDNWRRPPDTKRKCP